MKKFHQSYYIAKIKHPNNSSTRFSTVANAVGAVFSAARPQTWRAWRWDRDGL